MYEPLPVESFDDHKRSIIGLAHAWGESNLYNVEQCATDQKLNAKI